MSIPTYVFLFVATFAVTFLIEKRLIPMLSRSAEQPIYEGGPSWHIQKKGTPTMGGVAFLISVSVFALIGYAILMRENADGAASLLLAVGFSVANALVGIFDDLTKLKRKENAGLSPKQKLVLQFLIATAFLVLRAVIIGDSTVINISSFAINLGPFYYPLALIILLGITNCANLTDGVDGLASSVAFAISAVIFILSLNKHPDVSILCCTIIGAVLAFLIFNLNPAKIFMGDTGSLFLGAAIASMGFSMGSPVLLIPICAVYVTEGVSVILQVIYFKLTGKRLFKMAPVHHHLEKCGMSENKICVIGMLYTFISSLALILLIPS